MGQIPAQNPGILLNKVGQMPSRVTTSVHQLAKDTVLSETQEERSPGPPDKKAAEVGPSILRLTLDHDMSWVWVS